MMPATRRVVESVYTPCHECMYGRHMIRHTQVEMTVTVLAESGERRELTIPSDTTYLRVGTICYIPTLVTGDTIPEGHDKTLAELWNEHGLLDLEWAVPYG